MLGKQIRCLSGAVARKETFASAAHSLRILARKSPMNFCEYLMERVRRGEFSQDDSGDRRIFLIFLIEGKEQYFVEMLSVMLNHSPKMSFLIRLIAEKVLAVATELSVDAIMHCIKMAAEKSKINSQLKEIAEILDLAERKIA